MQDKYEIWFLSDSGRPIEAPVTDFEVLNLALVANDIGEWTWEGPRILNERLLRPDRIIEVWRKAPNRSKKRIYTGLLLDWQIRKSSLQMSGPCTNDLLRRRIVQAPVGSADSTFDDQPVDILYSLVSKNFTSAATDATRSWTAKGFSLDSNLAGIGTAIQWVGAHEEILKALQSVCAQSSRSLYFGIRGFYSAVNSITFRFFAAFDQLNNDRSASSGKPAFFGPEWDNLEDPVLQFSYRDMISRAYVGGPNTGADRIVTSVDHLERQGYSRWSFIEKWRDSGSADTADQSTDIGAEVFHETRPQLTFSGTIVDKPPYLYGSDWAFGDKVVCKFENYEFNANVDRTEITVTPDDERIISVVGATL